MRTTYGDLADEVLTSAMQQGGLRRDYAETVVDTLAKVDKGRPLSPGDARRLDNAGRSQNLQDAMAGRRRDGSARNDGAVANPFEGGPGASAPPADAAAVAAAARETLRESGQDWQAAQGEGEPVKPPPGTFLAPATGKDLQAIFTHRDDPAVLAEFDMTYGPGTARRALGEIDRQKLGGQR